MRALGSEGDAGRGDEMEPDRLRTEPIDATDPLRDRMGGALSKSEAARARAGADAEPMLATDPLRCIRACGKVGVRGFVGASKPLIAANRGDMMAADGLGDDSPNLVRKKEHAETRTSKLCYLFP